MHELNERNQDRLATLAWNPRRGVVSQAVLAEGQIPDEERLFAFLGALAREHAEDRFDLLEAAGETDESSDLDQLLDEFEDDYPTEQR